MHITREAYSVLRLAVVHEQLKIIFLSCNITSNLTNVYTYYVQWNVSEFFRNHIKVAYAE